MLTDQDTLTIVVLSVAVTILLFLLLRKNSKRKKVRFLLAANERIVRLHRDTEEFAVRVHGACVKANNGEYHSPLAGSALSVIHCTAIAIHRSILSLCAAGWAFVTPILLRTMLESLASVIVIRDAGEHAEYMGFKYLLGFAKTRLEDPQIESEERKRLEKEIKMGLSRLDPEQKKMGEQFIKGKPLRGFWWRPEHEAGVEKTVEEFLKDPDFIYRVLSGASHGGYLGLRFFRDEPGNEHPNPRPDPNSQTMALSLSIRLLLAISGVRCQFEKCGMLVECDGFASRLAGLRDDLE